MKGLLQLSKLEIKTISIIKNRIKYDFLFDIEDFIFYSTKKYYINLSGRIKKKAYLMISEKINNKWEKIGVHRKILNAKKGEYVDHINGNTLDNRKLNLRLCTNAENSRNSCKKRKNSSSQYKGVYKFLYKETPKKYVARIKKDYKYICLGYFKTEIEAAKAYNEAAIKYFGEFAKLNEIKNEN